MANDQSYNKQMLQISAKKSIRLDTTEWGKGFTANCANSAK